MAGCNLTTKRECIMASLGPDASYVFFIMFIVFLIFLWAFPSWIKMFKELQQEKQQEKEGFKRNKN